MADGDPETATVSPGEITARLKDWRAGDSKALEELMPLVYEQLRRVAARYMKREQREHTLQPTALVHEAYLRLVGDDSTPNWQDRAHFLAITARIMRRVLIDHARIRSAQKRGGREIVVFSLDEERDKASEQPVVELLALDNALKRLEKIDPRQSKIIELRFFGGLDLKETAEVMDLSITSVKRETRMARAWLYGHLTTS